MGADVEGLVSDLVEAFAELREEVSLLPEHERDDGERLRFGILDDVLRSSSIDDLRALLFERTRIAKGEEAVAWLEALFERHERHEEAGPVSQRRSIGSGVAWSETGARRR